MDGGEEGRGVFGVSGRNAPPLFERKKSILDQMAQFVEVLIIRSLNRSVFLGRNDRVPALRGRLLENRVGVITSIGDQIIGIDPRDQF